MIATGAGSFNGSSAALLVCNNKMAGFSSTHVWPCLMHWLSTWPGLLMVLACMVVLHAVE